MCVTRISACRTAATAAWLLLVVAAAAEEHAWRKLPPSPGRADNVSAIAVDRNTLWAMAGNSVAYWTGSEWRTPAGPPLRAGMFLATFQGGGDQPLYCTQPGQREHWGELYRLDDGAARLVTEFHYDVAYERPTIHVARSGQVVSFSKKSLAVLGGGKWASVEAPESAPLLFETEASVHCYYPPAQKLFQIDRANAIRETKVPLTFGQPRPNIKAVRWGDDRVLVVERGRAGLKGFSLATGEPLDLKQVNDKLGAQSAYDGFRTRDGSAWLLLSGGQPRQQLFARIQSSGQVETISSLSAIAGDYQPFLTHPESVLESKAGAIWLGGQHHALARLLDGKLTQFGAQTGYDLSHCTHLAEDQQGNIFAANAGGIYVWFAAVPPPSWPPPRQPISPGQALWTYRSDEHPPLGAAWKVGSSIYCTAKAGNIVYRPAKDGTSRSDAALIAVDADTGQLRYRARLDAARNDSLPAWLVESGDVGSVEFASPRKIERFDARSGKLQAELDLPHDGRLVPLSVPGGYLAIPQFRGSELIRVDREQRTIWKRPLPGYVMLHPVASGRLALIQTREGSYGGQRTVWFDTEKGDILWTDVTDAYGRGAAFFDEETFVVEADQWLAPQESEGWLICRDPHSGQRRWHYRRAGMIHHPPLVDKRTGRVYAVFERGRVVCLRGEDGSVAWEQDLPENALSDGAADSYNAAWSPHTLAAGRLAVVDRNLVLHVLDAKSGQFLVSVALRKLEPQSPKRPAPLIAAPWTTDTAIIVALSDSLTAFPLPEGLKR